jgi:hypothetical protein
MFEEKMRYFLGFLATILLIIVLIVLLVRGGGQKQKTPGTSKTLVSYASVNSEVSLTIDGPINANSKHQGVRITVDRNNATYEQLVGYDGQVVEMQQFPNSQNAYETFLLALERAGFRHGSKTVTQDSRGFCPQGNRFIYVLKQGDRVIQQYWASNCNDVKSYLGAVNLTNSLFQAQIPNYNVLSQDAAL